MTSNIETHFLHKPRAKSLGRILWTWRDLRNHRNRLVDLDDRLLSDIGVKRDIAKKEGGRFYWQVPRHWRL